jgi:ATP-binding cassette subfamily D (ALD) long-chain fatty acid import protein
MYSGKDLAELSGYTSRVYSLLASLHALDKDIYPQNSRPASLPDGTVSSSLNHQTKLMARHSTTWQMFMETSSSVLITS